MLKAFKRKAKQIRYPQGPSRHGNAKIPCYGEGVDVTLVQLPGAAWVNQNLKKKSKKK